MKRFKRLLTSLVTASLLLSLNLFSFAQHNAQHQGQSASPDCQLPGGSAISEGRTVYGEPKPIGNGDMRSWVRLNKAGKPVAVGIALSESALTGLPLELPNGEMGVEYVLHFPKSAPVAPFNHIGVNWNPKGHPPEHIYNVGHFDFHFYMISESERAAITAQGEDLERCKKKPADEFVPQDYFYAPETEHANMGSHWVDKNAHEFHGHHFTSTMIYGSYNGHFTFIEPMITKAFIESKPCFSQPVKQPAKFEKAGYYPTSYSIQFDPVNKVYNIALDNLTWR
ncbi:MAG: DUF5602 domain-containing protein [Acidobacteriota bacterium]